MILYTMVPYESIFYEDTQPSGNVRTIDVDGAMVIVEEMSSSEYRVVRLISSNPRHYLESRFAPGTVIYAKPQL
ncbi:YlzJ-like family protein [Halalkalibacterium halodurans]|jgi:hypothetical protein|uniref:YlzJ-like protein n=1 Tax=Halalkalibacterium halodurans TaxID=86665 RepID=A0A0M0KIX2_ALKHA|nr:YlzJ-like family protein [Halalkalibacterium halodurans]MED3646227.1 YlzJ-like family protein [Halalkalibacterium halodurans]MED4162138.1 YlzJ-like family protein [Halalkalibacterium halodurans]TES56852.1 hypothetical protein E2L07_03200 [Halalkalibacterium halodurans]TPE69578.1 hypothetical protein AMD02_007325 [Halalkalibacterium halodurans]